MKSIGIDPDLHDLSIGLWDSSGPVTASVVHLKQDASLTGPERVMRMIHAMQPRLNELPIIWTQTVKSIVVEGQSLRRQGGAQHARPGDIVKLAQVAGAALGLLMEVFGDSCSDYYLPEPEAWKGSVAKHAMQARLYADLGWRYEIIGTGKGRYARPKNIPTNFRHISKGQWKHVGDALLLARWAYEHQ